MKTKVRRYKKIPRKTNSKEKYIDSLIKVGYDEIGAGCYGVVLSKDRHKTVIKTGEVYENKGYLAFIHKVIKNPGNRFFPKIYSIEYFGKNYFSIKMEKLTPQHKPNKIRDHYDLNKALKKSKTKDSRVARQVLDTLFAKHSSDIHSENIMKRGKQIVIIDPVADF